jgi:hypothetical protein
MSSINMFASVATLLPVFTVPQPPTMLPLHRQTMSSRVKKAAKKTQLKPQLSTSINEIDEWAAGRLDAEIISGSDCSAANSMTTVRTLLEFYNTASFHHDDLALRVSLAHLCSHLLSTTVDDEEIFEGLEYAYKNCKKTPRDIRSSVIKKIFLSMLVRGRSDLITSKNRTHFNRLVGLYPDLLPDFSSGTLYYFDVYGKKG